ncbi:membrane alanyl aminopeptidase [Aeromicrobium marinum DSM 15272]|uniref:Aminopeptidase N n=1 Tax=Aeromicrobium marinum DSM 15272 TaxID=585531 RepID=E2SBB6_9ACTN|nr:aminopeptidase N [Aeromicrobium marinum]EFQ83662.1 membrane alanyl aminopeptidase [Aeromicrobium marinum DSM 15272]
MPGTNLTREEAQQRASVVSTGTYVVELDLTLDPPASGPHRFGSVTTLTFDATAGASTFVDLVDAEVLAVTLNGHDLPVDSYRDSRIPLTDLAEHNELRVEARCSYSHSGEGLHRFVDPTDDRVYLYTQFEVPDARRVFATFEQPDLKATFEFHVTAPSQWQVVSNSPTPEPEPVDGDTAVWHFAPTQVMSTYITALVAGEYHVVRDSYSGAYDDIPLGVFCRQSLVEHLDADDILLVTKQGFEFFEGAFEMGYPFGKYDQLFVPEYNMGAMENAGCVTFRDEMIFRSRQTVSAYEQRANTILHEMAHMWFGDLVTMRWWDDLWLNESFAEWAAHHSSVQATRFTDAWTGFTNNRKNWAYRQDQLPSTHPIAADNHDLHAVEANFDGITYAKGASSLKQLVAWVGEEDFLAGLRAYFTRHAFGNTELADLLVELEQASGRELESWSAEWLQTTGVNTLRARFETSEPDAEGHEHFTSFVVEQTAHPDHPTLRRHRIAIGLYDLVAGALVRTERIETDVRGAETEIAELVGRRRPDLVLLNDDDLTYAKIRLDDRSFQTLVGGIDAFEESLPRALCWGAAWDMTRDAELPSADFVSLVLAGVGSESDLTAVASLLRQGQGAVNLYTPEAQQPHLGHRWETGLRELVEAAEPGSDHQLALVRGCASAAQGPEFLRAVLGGALDGLAVDTDLRWTLLFALARLGELTDAELEAELERDPSNSGRERAAGVRAVRPTADAKAEAWHRAAVDAGTPNETRRNIAGAFQVSGQAELLRPYVDQYLSMADTVIDDMGVWIGQVALVHLFPSANPDEEVLAKVDAWLASTKANSAAVRYVSEGRDDLARALRARSA